MAAILTNETSSLVTPNEPVPTRFTVQDWKRWTYADCFIAPAIVMPVVALFNRCSGAMAISLSSTGLILSCVSFVFSTSAVPGKDIPKEKHSMYCFIFKMTAVASVAAFVLSAITVGVTVAKPNC